MTDDDDFPMSDASLFERDLYVEITIAWYQMQTRGSAVDRPSVPMCLAGALPIR